jgi:GNAT superfamily N-acetyltransferase
MANWPLALARARDDDADLEVILLLIEDAANWLRTKNTDQWATPWPNRAGRNIRIRAALRQGKSWICWDNGSPVATITADPDEDPYWPEENRTEPSIYVHRLVVSRQYAGTGLGAALLDWVGRTARLEHGARWIRLSAWTTNYRLHAYYRRQGFALSAFRPDDSYPSGAFFQKPTVDIPPAAPALFRQI